MEEELIYFWEDKLKDLQICKELVANYQQIKKEIIEFVSKPNSFHDYPRYKLGRRNEYYLYDNDWKAVPLSNFNGEFISLYSNEEQKKQLNSIIQNAKQNCPTIDRIISPLEQEGVLSNSFISRLFPGTVIHPHTGWTNSYMRIHLGIICDPECKITVGYEGTKTETKTWEEGKILAFRDAGPYPHSVKHNGTKERIILSIDILLSYLNDYINNC
jgi:hypothetical protein